MKVKYLLVLLCASVILNQDLFSAGKGSDPIRNSYIINNLKMESDTIPSLSDQDPGEGEIIFDNSFDDNLSKKSKKVIPSDSGNELKKIIRSDKRFHLVEYRIRRNENLSTIAKKSNISLKLLAEINKIKNTDRLKENDMILIPSNKGIFYKIRKGDTLTEISERFNTEVDIIAEHNNIDGKKIIAGRKIFLPDAVEPVILKKYKRDIEYTAHIDHHKKAEKAERNDTSNSVAMVERTDKSKSVEFVDRTDLSKPVEQVERINPSKSVVHNDNSDSSKSLKKTEIPDYSPPAENTEKIAITEKKIDKKSTGKVVLSWPLRGPITSGFGIRTHPFSGDKKFHCGLDIGAEVGTAVRSSGEGRVIFSGWKEAYGNMVVVSHKNNYITIYAHNSRNLVDVDEKIKKGQKIAISGKTGAVTGAHLHFEIRKGIVPLNPRRILK